jgi:hypothetical protein
VHCLTGCAIGKVLGMIIATALGWGNAASIGISIVLAFLFGYALTFGPILRAGVPLRSAARLTVASDTVSIATMEFVDNAFILLVPGAIAAGLSDSLFWWAASGPLTLRGGGGGSSDSPHSPSKPHGLDGRRMEALFETLAVRSGDAVRLAPASCAECTADRASCPRLGARLPHALVT